MEKLHDGMSISQLILVYNWNCRSLVQSSLDWGDKITGLGPKIQQIGEF